MTQECQTCYTCERGVSPEVTAKMFREARSKGQIPREWLTSPVTNCQNCYTCERGFVHDNSRMNQETSITYFLFLTNDCNLRCDYCYATKTPLTMSKETLEQVKAFLTQMEDQRLGKHGLNIHFFGGEPTVKWEMLEQFVVEFSSYYEKLYGRQVRWGMTTNGTLLDRPRLEFMKKYRIIPLLSLDGRASTHNKHRKAVGGQGSFDLIPLDLILEYFPGLEIRPTITPETVENWAEDLRWFHSKGLYAVATEVAYEADWTDADFQKARRMYEELVDIYVERRTKGLPLWMKFIEDGLMFLGATKQQGYVCGIARGVVAIDSLGKLYACQRYASFSRPELAIGDVWNGFDEHKLHDVQSLRREDMFPVEGFDCENCVARWRCRGGCNAMNFQCLGDRRKILPNYCRFQRLWAELSLTALARTGELWRKRGNVPGISCIEPVNR